MILICTQYFNEGKAFGLSSATDVLRLVVSLSGGDLKSTEKIRIKNLKRSERQFFLNLLENSTDLEEDVLRNKSIFKTFLKGLHVEDYKNKYTKVFEVKNQLFKGKLRSFNSVLEDMILRKDKMVFALLLTAKGRGVFMRSIKRLCDVYGVSLVSYNFAKVVSEYDTVQLLKLKRYMDNVLENKYRFFRPKSSFSKGQILENNVQFDVSPFQNILNAELKTRISKFGNIKTVGNLDQIKFQTTSNEVFSFGKGTEFPIPENVTFIRSASYWENKTHRNNWFDNGWNFFEEDWKLSGSLCWTETDFKNKAAIFSGDPTNSKDVNGRACQMIDLYFDKLVKAGVRYGVWNILCYSKIPFGDASDVFAALQWGENPQKGGLFEPKRCQVSFPLVGDVQNKFIAYVDFKERKLVFLDVTLKADVSSASKNQLMLVEKMPAIVEYLNYVPSLNDLMQFAEYDENQPVDYVVCYSDKDVTLSGEKAYIFKKENEQSKFEDVDINFFLKNQ